ncbi:hypothetical protein B0A50_03821 [Salinomyces thailandicus]|uniref:Hypervirulence associated protein TUDOR domain-containing protein n=1 Tax=Salinomyces thailandicus TaxID=706561 RepID=A0A4U0U0Y8_9PEZI|nr:hypothetical protein B0A50_03821 [Salinomyces thailandica]
MDSLSPTFRSHALAALPGKADPIATLNQSHKAQTSGEAAAQASNVNALKSSSCDVHSTLAFYNSPPPHEIDLHSTRERLSHVRDDSVTISGAAPEDVTFRNQSRQESSVKPAITRAMGDNEIKEGDQVAWQWGGGKPGGVASEVKEQGELTMETKRGNEVKKNAEPDNPAVKVDREGHDVVKKASELEVEEAGPKHKDGEGEKDGEADKDEAKEDEADGEKDSEKDGEKKAEENGDAQPGDKRKAEDESKDDAADNKKQKANGEKAAPKKKGRPAKNASAASAKKDTKKREPKKAATESGQPRRSGRVASK